MAYRGEVCQDCGFPVAYFTRSWWQAPAGLWLEVMGHDGGILCPPCFTVRCESVNRPVHYEAVEGV